MVYLHVRMLDKALFLFLSFLIFYFIFDIIMTIQALQRFCANKFIATDVPFCLLQCTFLCNSQGVKCIFLGEPGKWVQSVFMLYRYCSP